MFLCTVQIPLGILHRRLGLIPVLICCDAFTPIWWGSFFRLLSALNSENEGPHSRARVQLPHCSGTVLFLNNKQMTWNDTWLRSTQSYFAPPLWHIRIKTEKSSDLTKTCFSLTCCFYRISASGFRSIFPCGLVHLCTSFQSIPLTELASNLMKWRCQNRKFRFLFSIDLHQQKHQTLASKVTAREPKFKTNIPVKNSGNFTLNSMLFLVKHIDV